MFEKRKKHEKKQSTNEKTEFFRRFRFSRENKIKLEQYIMLLFEANKSINLIARKATTDIWTRHVLDSAQLFYFIPTTAESLVDLGSGAGFPGMVLGIMGAKRVNLIESVKKKANFLEKVVKSLGLANVFVQAKRIEEIQEKFDVVTARALKPLPQLLTLAFPLTHEKSVCLFLKGKRADEELTEAYKYWTFECEKIPSISDSTGVILKISSLLPRDKNDGRKLSGRKR